MADESLPVVKLGDVLPASYKNGIYKSADFYGEGVPVLRINDFDNQGLLVNENLQKVRLTDSEVESYSLKFDDIIVNRVNSLTHIGKSILWKGPENGSVVYESNMMRIEADRSSILPEYLIRILHSYTARTHFRKVAKRAVAQCSVSQQDVKSLIFPLPPLAEQQKIAKILSTWDEAIATTEQLLANSEQQKKALMQQLLTGKKRLPGFEGEWRTRPLGELIEEISKLREEEPWNFELLSVRLHYNGVVPTGKCPKKTNSGRPYLKRFAGELIVGRQNLHNGGVALVGDECDGLIASNAISSFKAKESSDLKFILYKMSTKHFRFVIGSLSGGTGQKEVGVRDLLKVQVEVPNIAEQVAIASVLSLSERQIYALKKEVAALKDEKKALMQQLLTGKRRVKIDEAERATA